MNQKFVALPWQGKRISPTRLTVPKARDIALLLQEGWLNWATLIECQRHSDRNIALRDASVAAESVILEVEVELPQRPVFPVQRIERIAVTFSKADDTYPEVHALRADFPKASHVNLREYLFPRSLCLYDESYSEVQLHWTASEFIERIRTWLAETATGELHKRDQALEPLLLGSAGTIILPAIVSSITQQTPQKIEIFRTDHEPTGMCLVAVQEGRLLQANNDDKGHPPLVTLQLIGQPQSHGIIQRHPANLLELHLFLETAQINLLESLRAALSEWQTDVRTLNAGLILLVILPKVRSEGAQPEAADIWAFLCIFRSHTEKALPTIQQIGEQIGVWKKIEGKLARLIPFDLTKKGESVGVIPLNPSPKLSRELAASYNGQTKRGARKITLIGVGALGSQVFFNLIRAGYGEWTLIDNDQLLPHNFARHALYGHLEGVPKARAAALVANQMIDGPPIATAIIADVLAPEGDHLTALNEADILLDCSASVAVARHLSQAPNRAARQISLFLNPQGTDIVMLAEDAAHKISSFALEAQYYRVLLNDPVLAEHLGLPAGRIRYGRSCRDLSSTIAQEQVALHAAIGSRAFRTAVEQDDATIAIWQSDPQGQVRRFSVTPQTPVIYQMGNWTVLADELLFEQVRQWRASRLPNETGGVLIGCYDMPRKQIYVASALPSPGDSEEEATGFTRGTAGLKQQIENIQRITANHLGYVGEWHSHPPGFGVAMSGADKKLLTWVSQHLNVHGKPSLMLIVGKDDVSWHLEQRGRRFTYGPR
jgi:hypothetical protein